MSELAATVREALVTLAAADQKLIRFGAAQHRYELAPPLAEIAPSHLSSGMRTPTKAETPKLAENAPSHFPSPMRTPARSATTSDPENSEYPESSEDTEEEFGSASPKQSLSLGTPRTLGTLGFLRRAGLDELVEFVTTVGSGGAGPYYGWIPIDRAVHAIADAPPNTPWTRALPIAHLGCGYAAVCPLDGDARGQIWLDARALGIAHPIHPSFAAFYIDWIDRLARNAWPESYVPPGVCALPGALGGYLGAYEQAHGLAAGTLAGEPLREALAQLGPEAIEIAGEPPLFDPSDRVDPCIACARLVENLGLRRDVVAPGLPPRAVR